MLKRLVDEVEAAVASLDPAALHPRDAVRLLEDATRLRNLAAAACTILSKRAAESGQWRRDGARTEGEWLARRMGTNERDAVDALKTAKAIEQLPSTAQALRAGAFRRNRRPPSPTRPRRTPRARRGCCDWRLGSRCEGCGKNVTG